MSKTELNPSRWLEAHCDRSADVTTLPNSLVLADTCGDGEFRLVLADVNIANISARLKVYRGTVLGSDQPLPGLPSSLVAFYVENMHPKIASVGVSCGSDFLIYKNNKPFYKYTAPSLPIDALELDVWQKLATENNVDKLLADLKTISYSLLSSRSQTLLDLPPTDVPAFIERYGGTEPTKESIITCTTTLKKNSEDPLTIACPVLATEFGHVYVLDPQTFTVIHEARTSNVNATPYVIRATGTFDVDYRIFVACRERYVSVLRRGWLEGKTVLQATSHIVDMVITPGDNFICLATSDKTISCYSKRGNKLWSTNTVQPITCLALVTLKHLSISLLAVGMQGGSVHLYHNRHPVDYITAPDTPSAITFGQLGQEEHVMVIVTLCGTLNFKILKRTADFNLNRDGGVAPASQSKPLPLPKRSKLFLEQSARERQHAVEMHRAFQQDLVRLRLTAARTTVQNNSDQTGISNEKEQLKISAQVVGLGPKFTLILMLDNMSAENALVNLSAVFHCAKAKYELSSYYYTIPLVPPGHAYKIETKVLEHLDVNKHQEVEVENVAPIAQTVRVFVLKEANVQPILAASISMPPTDPLAYTI